MTNYKETIYVVRSVIQNSDVIQALLDTVLGFYLEYEIVYV